MFQAHLVQPVVRIPKCKNAVGSPKLPKLALNCSKTLVDLLFYIPVLFENRPEIGNLVTATQQWRTSTCWAEAPYFKVSFVAIARNFEIGPYGIVAQWFGFDVKAKIVKRERISYLSQIIAHTLDISGLSDELEFTARVFQCGESTKGISAVFVVGIWQKFVNSSKRALHISNCSRPRLVRGQSVAKALGGKFAPKPALRFN